MLQNFFNINMSAAWSSGEERRDCDGHGSGSKPTRAIPLRPGEIHLMALSILAVLPNISVISLIEVNNKFF